MTREHPIAAEKNSVPLPAYGEVPRRSRPIPPSRHDHRLDVTSPSSVRELAGSAAVLFRSAEKLAAGSSTDICITFIDKVLEGGRRRQHPSSVQTRGWRAPPLASSPASCRKTCSLTTQGG